MFHYKRGLIWHCLFPVREIGFFFFVFLGGYASTQQKRRGELNALKTAFRTDQNPLLLWSFSTNYFFSSIFNCSLPAQLCCLWRNCLYRWASSKTARPHLSSSWCGEVRRSRLLLERGASWLPGPGNPRLSAPRASPPVSIALDQFISPQLGVARKAKIKGESRSCIFIFSLLEGNWFPCIYFGSCNTQGRICVTRATCRWR